ncbi:MAG: rhodanese-like domain-containing protein, partial [Polyangiales bacterium]
MSAPATTTLWEHAVPAAAGYREVGPDAVARLAAEVRVVDVREPDEYDGVLGHVPGSELVPLDTVSRRFEREDRDSL